MPPSIVRPWIARRAFVFVAAAAALAAAAPQEPTGPTPTSAPTSRPRQNRLAAEKSPYLRLHATNLVDWFPWGEEAFAKARRENKPIFLSSGYASCHWCHVMARESFDDPQVAALLNAHFVPIKIDREERPDVDRIYVEACALMTGSAGWPLSAFLTPDRRPFYLGTYFPPEDQGGTPGFASVLAGVRDLWAERGADVVESAAVFAEGFGLRHLATPALEKLVAELRRAHFAATLAAADAAASRPAAESRPEAEQAPEDLAVDRLRFRLGRAEEALALRKAESRPVDLLDALATRLAALEDAEAGGIGLQPKFPAPLNLVALLRRDARKGGDLGRGIVLRQLGAMKQGGILDVLAGGWHRYAVDRRWTTPHFEKMLYDQALMAEALREAWQAAGDPIFEALARETLDFCLRDLPAEGGGYVAALDAESDGEEGSYYLWSRAELRATLDADSYALVGTWAGFEADGVADDERATLAGRTPFAEAAALLKIDLPTAFRRWGVAKAALLKARAERPAPRRVATVIAGWNAHLVSALARAGATWGDARYLDAAKALMAFLDAKLLGKDGLYVRRSVEGEARFAGDLSDQSAALNALLDLHEATTDLAWLARAEALAERIVAAYGAEDGGLFDSVASDLPWRTRETEDGPVPSGAGGAAVAFARLAALTQKPAAAARAERLLAALLPAASAVPADHPSTAIAHDLLTRRVIRVAFHGPPEAAGPLAAKLRAEFRPFVVITRDPDETPPPRAFAVVCVGTNCLEPAYDAAELLLRVDAASK